MEERSSQYLFGPDFQKKILALMFRDPQWLSRHHDVVSPSYFTRDDLMIIATITTDYFKAYGRPPVTVIRDLLISQCQKYRKSDGEIFRLQRLVDELETIDLSDEAYISDRVRLFGRRQAMCLMVSEFVDLVEKDPGNDLEYYDGAQTLVDKALSVGRGASNDGLWLGDILDNPFGTPESRARRVPTGYPLLDAALGGGLEPGELFVILAAPGVGKTLMMLNMALYAVRSGFSVAFFTMEMTEERIGRRIVARLTGIPMNFLKEPTEESKLIYSERRPHVENVLGADWRDRFVVKYYAPKRASCGTLRSHLSYLHASRGFKPNLCFVDYADKMKPMRSSKNSNLYQEVGETYEGLDAIGDDFEMPLVTGSQLNRYGVSESKTEDSVAGMNNVADSARKGHDADGVYSLNQTPEEKAVGRLRGYLDKCRDGESGLVIDHDVDYSRMKLTQSDTQVSNRRFHMGVE